MNLRLLAAALLTAAAASGQTSILQRDPLDCFDITHGGATVSQVDVEGPGFTRALRIGSRMSANPWDVRVLCKAVQPVRLNDAILATFWMRTVSAPRPYGITTFVVEHDAWPYNKPATWTAVAGSEWKKFQVPFTMTADYPTPQGVNYFISFWVTIDAQVIDIGGITIDNYGPGRSLSELGFTYEGREADAPWRAPALERIERIRKSDIVVVVKDDAGNPVAGAPVRVRMKRHAFGFGTAIATDQLTGNARYQQELRNNFNKVVFENHLKWGMFENLSIRPMLDASFAWLVDNGFRDIRGHNVIWPGFEFVPNYVDLLIQQRDVDGLRAAIERRFSDVMTYTKGKVTEWDVLNEPYSSKDIQAVLGDEEMAAWFKRARELDPGVKLFINDYSILSSGGGDIAHQDHYFNTIKFILDRGGPIDGIGFQGHFNMNLTSPARVLEILDRFAAFGKDLEITEHDIDISDEEIQADYLRDFLTVTFSHPSVTSFLIWGFWEGAHWTPRGAMFRLNWDEKPIHRVWRDLIYNQWWTNADGVTGPDGVYRTRGFLGEYEVTVGDRTSALAVEAGKPASLAVTVPVLKINAIVNAASFRGGGIAPGEIVDIWGEGFGPDGVRVLFDGVAALIIHSFQDRVAAIVPYSVSGTTRVEVEYQGLRTNAVDVPVVAAAPGIFTAASSGSGMVSGGVLLDNAWVRIDSGANKPRRGTYVCLYLTGEGRNQPITVRFDGIESRGQYNWSGLVYNGVTQVNAYIPDTVRPGDAVPVEITVGGIPAQSGVTIPVE